MSQSFTSNLPVPLPVSRGGTGRTTAGTTGTTTNDNATAGDVGEVVTSAVVTQAVTSATFHNVTSISVPAGDWDIFCGLSTNPAGATTQALVFGSLSTTSATLSSIAASTPGYPAGNSGGVSVPTARVSLSGTTTYYLVGYISYAISTLTENGTLTARRRR